MAKQTQMHISQAQQERVILVGVDLDNGMQTEACLDELEELVKTAGAVTVAKAVQKRDRIHPGHYIGKGKLERHTQLTWMPARKTRRTIFSALRKLGNKK